MTIDVNVYHHFPESPPHDGRIDQILVQLAILREQGDKLMSASDDAIAKLDRIDLAANNIAADVRRLTSQIGTGMTQDEVDAVNARLEATAVALEALAAETPDA